MTKAYQNNAFFEWSVLKCWCNWIVETHVTLHNSTGHLYSRSLLWWIVLTWYWTLYQVLNACHTPGTKNKPFLWQAHHHKYYINLQCGSSDWYVSQDACVVLRHTKIPINTGHVGTERGIRICTQIELDNYRIALTLYTLRPFPAFFVAFSIQLHAQKFYFSIYFGCAWLYTDCACGVAIYYVLNQCI